MNKHLGWLWIVVVLLLAVGCDRPAVPAAPTVTPESAGLPNPATQFCLEQGGRSEIRDEADGQVGYCLFDDGSECEEWAYFRGECQAVSGTPAAAPGAGIANPATTYCIEQGGKSEIRDEADGQVGYCLFDDGLECEEWAYFRGECKPQ